MAKKQPPKRRPNPPATRQEARPATPPAAPRAAVGPRTEKRPNVFTLGSRDMLFGRRNFILMGAGLALVLIGLALMAGGAQPDPNVWKDEIPYSFTRITLAPLCMVAGFVVAVWGIFAKDNSGKVLENDSSL
ncbi:MAG: DUF3098 domain-containing protein [Saprospiraceae bacterium]|nr:DUF3098 domain-containing protein [Saprospiraceae bacterium]